MKKPFIDHSWSKIVDKGDFAKIVLAQKLKLLEEVAGTIGGCSDADADSVENVLAYQQVRRALEQCLAYLEGRADAVTETDYFIYWHYADYRLRDAERIIDDELSDLGL